MARISDKVRARAIALLMTGEAQAKVAEAAGISVRSVQRIAQSIRAELDRFRTEQKHDLDQLLLEYVAENLRTQTVLLQEIRRTEFVRAQKARDLGVLLGILGDKAFRVLSAATGVGPGPEAGPGEEEATAS